MKEEPAAQLALFERHTTNYQSNVFTLSRQEFTELEKRIVILLVNQLGNMAAKSRIQPDRNLLFSIPYSELTKNHHSQVTEAAEGLSKKRISYKDEAKGEYIFVTPFPFVKSRYENGRRYIEIKVLADVVPHFAALGKRFTKYELDIMWSLSSIYAMRVFEIVSMHYHIQKNNFRFQVDELRYILNCPDTYRYNDFVKYVLEVTQRELKQKANIFLDWQPAAKIGKRVTELEFSIKTEKQLANDNVKADETYLASLPPNERVILGYQVMAKYQLKSWQKDHIITDPNLLDTLFRLHSEFENQRRPEVKNKNKYLAKSLGLDKLKEPKKSLTTTSYEPQISFVPPAAEKRLGGDAHSISSLIPHIISKK
ncbi:RepB family plasmid replication initiator protein [Spirosoma sp. HMF3257]|uniref:Replication initiation protein n=1 Tax=Spirosoma telluris TaxID=2183553 RepID=A0A327NCR2_9BACT|nr:RepB family plasmid replication initiator protein [Spirosoma telluris]RAI72997.1 replication initiation protein [Spirosoma telluris]